MPKRLDLLSRARVPGIAEHGVVHQGCTCRGSPHAVAASTCCENVQPEHRCMSMNLPVQLQENSAATLPCAMRICGGSLPSTDSFCLLTRFDHLHHSWPNHLVLSMCQLGASRKACPSCELHWFPASSLPGGLRRPCIGNMRKDSHFLYALCCKACDQVSPVRARFQSGKPKRPARNLPAA